MQQSQSAILAPVPRVARHLSFSLAQPSALRGCLSAACDLVDDGSLAMGLGLESVSEFPGASAALPGMREMPALSAGGIPVPSTPSAFWCWLKGEDQGDLFNRTRRLERMLAPALVLQSVVDTFRHGRGPNGHGRDLTEYEDGTENPEGDAAAEAALLQGAGAGLDGSSFVALQQWKHDFAAFDALSEAARDDLMGRRLGDNEELEDAPASAHVKRTAQESFDPEAFVWRRSMPWALGRDAGLMYVAFGRSFDAFEAQLRRMAGLEDGIVDGLFGMSRPLTGAYIWCPPVRDGHLDLRVLGI